MLAFIDESGDTGLKVGLGSSNYFVVTMVLFSNYDDALVCDQAIETLKRNLKPRSGEFKFSRMKHEARINFLEEMSHHTFFYFSFVVNKHKINGEGFKYKESFYKFTCGILASNAEEYLDNAVVVIDGSGSRLFKQQLKNYLRKKVKPGTISKLKVQDSHKNNLIQLADIVCGAVHRSFAEKKEGDAYIKIIDDKKGRVQLWPK